MSRHTVTSWDELTRLLLDSKGKTVQLVSMYGKRGKEKMAQDNEIREVHSLTLEITEPLTTE